MTENSALEAEDTWLGMFFRSPAVWRCGLLDHSQKDNSASHSVYNSGKLLFLEEKQHRDVLSDVQRNVGRFGAVPAQGEIMISFHF